MPSAYTYQAALYCEDCGAAIRAELDKAGKRPADVDDEHTYDSGDYPKGPDPVSNPASPNHCDGCGEFLENPLTDDGHEYVCDSIADWLSGGEGREEIIREWMDHYDIGLAELIEHRKANEMERAEDL